MNVFVAAILIVASVFLMIVIIVRNSRSEIPSDARSRHVPFLMAVNVAVFLSDLLCGGNVCLRMLTDLSSAVSAMLVLTISLAELKFALRMVSVIVAFQIGLAIYYFLSFFGVFPMLWDNAWVVFPVLPIMSVMGFFLWTVWYRVYNIKMLMTGYVVTL